MATTLVRHHVQDYDAWRRVYDEVAPMQRQGGVIEESVMRDKDDPNDVLVLHRFDTMSHAQQFFARDDLRDAMTRAGVVGQPRIEFYDEA
jgi:quinol monooxygenase YgiN